MWERITKPDILIYLDVSYEITLKRKNLNWTRAEYITQIYRLQHARQNAQILINTDLLTPEELVSVAVAEIDALAGNLPC
jgi:thymidylate kinase